MAAGRAGLPLALTMGEPAGIGPDIALLAWPRRAEFRLPPFYCLADPALMAARAATLDRPVPIAATTPAEAAGAAHPGTVTSPMVGVAYLLPEPGAQPFVQPGARVAQGQTLLLIEAMKTFNQIKAPRAGTVTRILVENGSPVEYGEPLMVIE